MEPTVIDILTAGVLTFGVAIVLVRFGLKCLDKCIGYCPDYDFPDIPEEDDNRCRYCEGGDHDCWCSYVEMDDERN